MQVFTLKQEFRKSADNLDYEYLKDEKCGRDRETERVSVRDVVWLWMCAYIHVCI